MQLVEYKVGEREEILKKNNPGWKLTAEHTNSDGTGRMVFERDLEAEIDGLKDRLLLLETAIKI